MKKITIVFFLVLYVFSQSFLPAQTKAEKIDQLISKYYEYGYFNGSALVADKGDVIFEKGYGFANMEWNIPNTPDTKFRLGSITKQFTSMLIMQLVEKGMIKLDGKITDYLPYYRKDTGDKITIHQLLTHSSGIPSYTSLPNFFQTTARTFHKPDDFIKEFCSRDLEFEPGSSFAYNNSAYFILGAIIEHVLDMPYDKALGKFIYQPLGMKNSGYDWSEEIIPNRAAGYQKTISGYKNAPFIEMALPYSAGSLYSTVRDLFVWDKAFYSNKLLSKEYWNMLFAKQIKAGGIGSPYYGYGWALDIYYNGKDSLNVITHGGSVNGFNTNNYIIPQTGQIIILLNNTGSVPLGEITNQILSILNGKETFEPKQRLAEFINKRMEKDGIEAAVSMFNQLKNDKDHFRLSENDFNNLGYEYLKAEKLDEAIAVFKLNTEEYPKSYNAFDSYAEALLKKGEKEEAIKNYKKSLELNPSSQSGINALKDLGIEVETAKDISVSVEVLNQYAGEYQLAPNFVITITVIDEKIFAKATGQPQFEIFPESETKFYLKVVEAKIEFVKESGKVTKLMLFQNGREMPAKKIE